MNGKSDWHVSILSIFMLILNRQHLKWSALNVSPVNRKWQQVLSSIANNDGMALKAYQPAIENENITMRGALQMYFCSKE